MNTEYAKDLHYLWWLTLACVLGVLIYLLSPILTPFLLAAVIAYICNPLVSRMATYDISRTIGTILVMLLLLGTFAAFILVMLPLFEKEATRLIEKIPAYLEMLRNNLIPWLEIRFNISLQTDISTLKQMVAEHWQSAGGVAAKILPSLTSGGVAIVTFFVNLVLVPVVLFYLLRDWEKLINHIDQMIPRYWHNQVNLLAKDADRILAEFLRGQLAVIILMSICYITGLWIVGLEFALPIGLLAGVLVFVPYLGMIVGLLFATFAAAMQFQDWSGVVIVWAVFGAGQMLESFLITPWLVGDRIGLHPVIVIFALLAFGQLFGFFGILLALPISAVLLVWLRHIHKQYIASTLYSK